MLVNRYYDLTDDARYTPDDEGTLVQLCHFHAGMLARAREVAWAGAGDVESCCEYGSCEQSNDPAYQAQIDSLVAALMPR